MVSGLYSVVFTDFDGTIFQRIVIIFVSDVTLENVILNAFSYHLNELVFGLKGVKFCPESNEFSNDATVTFIFHFECYFFVDSGYFVGIIERIVRGVEKLDIRFHPSVNIIAIYLVDQGICVGI